MLGRLKGMRAERGFTMVEILIVMVIFGVIMAIAVPAYTSQLAVSREKAISAFLSAAEVHLKQERTEGSGRYPGAMPNSLEVPDEVRVFEYTSSENRDQYCLSVTYQGKKGTATRHLNGKADGSATQPTETCSFGAASDSVVLEGTVKSDGGVALEWTKAKEDGIYYEVLKDGAQVFTTMGTTNEGSNFAKPGSLSRRSTFQIIVHGQVEGKSNIITLAPHTEKPSLAPILTLSNIVVDSSGNSSAFLRWNGVAWADEYEIYDSATNAKIGTVAASKKAGNQYEEPVTVAIGEIKAYYVVAHSSAGDSPKSNTVVFKGANPDAPILSLNVTSETKTSAKLEYTWTAPNGGSRYDLYINNVLVAKEISVRSYTYTTPRNKGLIEAKVVAVGNNEGKSTDSNISSYDSNIPPLMAPTVKELRDSGGEFWIFFDQTPDAEKWLAEVNYLNDPGSSRTVTWTRSNTLHTRNFVERTKDVQGRTVSVRIKAINSLTESDWSPTVTKTMKVVPENPNVTLSSKIIPNTAQFTADTASNCQAGTDVRYQTDLGTGTFGAWSNWVTLASSSRSIGPITSGYGGNFRINTQTRCVVQWTQAGRTSPTYAYSNVVERQSSSPAPFAGTPIGGPTPYGLRTVSAPSGGRAPSAVSFDWLARSGTPECPAGTVFYSRVNYSAGGQGWSGWSAANYGTRTRTGEFRFSAIPGSPTSFSVAAVCLPPGHGSTVYLERVTNPLSVTVGATPSAPTGVSLDEGSGIADWDAKCTGYKEVPYFFWEKLSGAFTAQSGWTTSKSTGNSYIKPWGNGQHQVTARCQVNDDGSYGSGLRYGPSVTVKRTF